ncbi:MAG: 4Fe-4S dicluster domain-containing protein [Desulfobacterales bacterium]|nr:4Fe-4S dicluster domain-containing protein [Desulfobacterales bacterium]
MLLSNKKEVVSGMNTYKIASVDAAFTAEVEERSGQIMSQCYQCGNCTAGCPYTFAYDIPVNQIMRLIQLGQRDTVLKCRSLWLCATCQSCTTRCPNNIDVAGVMDHLRHMAREQGYATEKNVKIFVDTFLESVEKYGRVFEMGLMTNYVKKTGRFWTDMDLAPKVLPKGKLPFKPHPIQGRGKIAEIFKRFREGQRK